MYGTSIGMRSRATRVVLAYLLSAFGFEFLVFVLTVHVYELTGNAWNVGVFTALTFVPRLFSPYYGSLVDRYPRGRLFFGATLATALGVQLIAAAQSIALTYVAWLVLSVLAMIIMNVRTAIMTEVFPGQSYLRGNSIMLISLNAAKLLAPLLGGVVTLRWSAAPAMQLTAAVYVTAAFLGATPKLAPVSARSSRSAAEVLTHLRQGARYLLSNRDLRYLGTVALLWRLSLAMQAPLFVVYVKESLGRGSAGYGMFMTTIGIGSLVGSALGPRLAAFWAPRRIVFWGLAAHYVSFALLGVTRSFAVSLVLAATGYLVFYATVVSIHSLRDAATPVAYRGRVYGCITGVLTPAALASILAGSSLASAVGVQAVLTGGGLLGVASLVAARFRLAPSNEPRPGDAPSVEEKVA
jgi:MFS family permease